MKNHVNLPPADFIVRAIFSSCQTKTHMDIISIIRLIGPRIRLYTFFITIVDRKAMEINMKYGEFSRESADGFNYVCKADIEPGGTIYIKMPRVTYNRRGINDIGWQTDSDKLLLYGSLTRNPNEKDILWDRILTAQDVNKVTACLKAVNTGESVCRLTVRVIMN